MYHTSYTPFDHKMEFPKNTQIENSVSVKHFGSSNISPTFLQLVLQMFLLAFPSISQIYNFGFNCMSVVVIYISIYFVVRTAAFLFIVFKF